MILVDADCSHHPKTDIPDGTLQLSLNKHACTNSKYLNQPCQF
jgi:hypothetical protein